MAIETTDFTPRLHQVLVLAKKESDLMNHCAIGSGHLILGLLRLDQGVAITVLRKRMDINLELIRATIEKMTRTDYHPRTDRPVDFNPRAKDVLNVARAESRQLNHPHIGTEHLVMALVQEHACATAEALVEVGIEPERFREETLKELGTTLCQ